MNPRVKDVIAKKDYTLLITFTNGEKKIFDVKPYLETGVFKQLKNPVFFITARAEYGTVVWNDELDIDPDTLFLESITIN